MRIFFQIIFIFTTTILIGCGKTAVKKNVHSNNTDSTKISDPDIKNNSSQKRDSATIDPSGEEVITAGIDTSEMFIDTILHYTSHKLIVSKEKFDATKHKLTADDLEFNPLIVYIVRNDNDSVVYKQKLEENQFVSPYSFKEKNLQYISLSIYSGGSGYMSTIYRVELEGTPTLQPVFNYSELTSYMFSTDGSQILVMQGIWEMGDDSDESHFSDHKYDISIVELSKNKTETRSISITSNKYPSADYDFSAKKLFNMINQKEPQTLKGYNFDKFPTK